MSGPNPKDARMASQRPSAPPEAPTASNATATEELSRFASYVEFRTRDLRQSVAQYLGTQKSPANDLCGEDDDEDHAIFTDVGGSGEGWVSVADDAVDGPEAISPKESIGQLHQNRPPPPPGPGPIQQTTLATQRAALQALGLTGTYLEHGLRLVAEDVGWLTHTATFEDATRKLRLRFPFLERLGESYGRGARSEGMRRLVSSGSSGVGAGTGSRSGDVRADAEEFIEQPVAKTEGEKEVVAKKLEKEEIGRFGELVEVPLHDNDEIEDEDDGWETLAGGKT